MFLIVRKLKCVKNNVKQWAKHQRENIHDKLPKNAKKIDYVEQRILSSPGCFRFNY